jgi:hypothetical protein
VSCVELTKVVTNDAGSAGGGLTAHFTTEPLTKFVPITVSVMLEALHDGVVLFVVVDEVTDVTVGPVMVNGIAVEIPLPAAPCVRTFTCAVPVA